MKILTPSNIASIFSLFFLIYGIQQVHAQTGAALNFDGTNDYLLIPTTGFEDSASFTIECWIKADALAYSFIFENTQGNVANASLEGNTDNLGFWLGGESVVNTGPLNLNEWYHIACTYDDQLHVQSIYLNGNLMASTNYTADPNFGGEIIVGARLIFGLAYFYPGTIDEFRVWTRPLSSIEIESNYNCEFISAQPFLVRSYNLNQGNAEGNNASELTAIDASGNGANANLNNFALAGLGSNWIGAGGVNSGTTCANEISENEMNISFSIYPNPTSGRISVISNESYLKTPYYLIDGSGRFVKTGFIMGKQSFIEFDEVEQGSYIFMIGNESHALTKVN